jgi:hypothetical protein
VEINENRAKRRGRTALPQGERIPAEKWEKIADDYMEKMGFGNLHQRVYVMHDDADGQHIHIIASRIDLTGKMYLGQNENLKSTQHIAQLERDHGLIITQLEPDPDKPRQRPPTPGEKGMAERTGEVPTRLQLQAIIDQASADRPGFAVFVTRLDASGLWILPSGKTGSPQGISFEFDGKSFKGSDLGKGYAWKGLQARIDYDLNRDQKIIDDLRARAIDDYAEEKGELSTSMPYFAPEPRKGQPRTLELALDREGDTYKWKTSGRVALIDMGNSILVMSRADSAIRASLQLSKDKGWQSVTATGNEEFRRKSWLIGSEMGLKVEGYEPSQADRDELKNILAQKKAARNEWKNGRDAEQGNGSGSANNDGIRVGGTGATNGNRPEPDRRASPSSDRGSHGSESQAGQQSVDIGDIQAASSDYSRSSPDADTGCVGIDWRDISSMRSVCDTVDDLAATLSENRKTEPTGSTKRSDSTQQITREHAAKLAAWKRQSEALNADKYRITLKARQDKNSNGKKLYDHNYGNKGTISQRKADGVAEKFWTKDEISAEIANLRVKNAQGYDIYITPIDINKHYLVVDDMTPDNEKALLDAGFKPAIIQRSSENNKQAIIVIDREKEKLVEQQLANKIVMLLNKRFGDPRFSGAIHPFRMAGFSNKKPGKNNYLTTIETSIHRKCEKTSVAMNKIRDDATKNKQNAYRLKTEQPKKIDTDNERNARMQNMNKVGHIHCDAVVDAYRREVKKFVGLVQKMGWKLVFNCVNKQYYWLY